MGTRLDGKVAVITGGASGIGWRTAELFVERGARVVLGDRNEALLTECFRALGEELCFISATEVTEENDVERLVQSAVDRFGRLDIAVNCAGIGAFAPIHEHPAETWRAVLDVCLTGVFFSVKHEARQMLSQGEGGAIVNVASINARQAAEGMSAYCSAKAGVEMLTKVAGMELGPRGIRVNAVAPGFVETPMTAGARPALVKGFLDTIPLGRTGKPDDIAQAVLFLVGEEASWVNAETLVVDGGEVNREYPRLMTDRRLG
jgi:NAD(P)-dependent dehydrogenase (short-subunit alcohol dehydrogenase family)